MQERVTGWPNTDVESIDGTDHFLNGRHDVIVRRIAERLEGR
jgi:alpha/beta superfamily hydrolase